MTKKEAISLLEGEIIRCRMAPKINGCQMTEEWQITIEVCQIAIEAIREKEQRRWIPVTERLPEEFISVIVSIPSEHPLPTVKEAYMANGCWVTKMAIFSSNDITHWMPLPEPPKEGANNGIT